MFKNFNHLNIHTLWQLKSRRKNIPSEIFNFVLGGRDDLFYKKQITNVEIIIILRERNATSVWKK